MKVRMGMYVCSAVFMAGFMAMFMAGSIVAAQEAFEVGPHNREELPGGKEADGIVGDFILRNGKIEAVVSGNLPLRRANMTTFYANVTPGTLYDLSLRGEDNDQLTIFGPSNQQGPVSYVRIVSDGEDGEAVLETIASNAVSFETYSDMMRHLYGLYTGFTSAPKPESLSVRHTYHLHDDWQGLLIVTTLRNEGGEPVSFTTVDYWKTLSDVKTVDGIATGDSVDPADKAGYAFAWVEREGGVIPDETIEIGAGQEVMYARFLAVGRSPVEAFGEVSRWRGEVGSIRGVIEDESGAGVASARVKVYIAGEWIHAYPDETGQMAFVLPAGTYPITIEDMGRPSQEQTLTVAAEETTSFEAVMPPPAAIAFDIRDEEGMSIPCKVQFIGINGTASPHLGPNNRAHGCLDQYHSETGSFIVQLPPGDYRVVVTRGIEFSHLSRDIRVSEGETVEYRGTLSRIVDASGWVSCDFHNHSTPSGDNTCGTFDRVINLAAEHIEFAPTTEHNRIYDWTPYIEALGLEDEIKTIPGIELTGSGPHFNAFPYDPKPYLQDGGAPLWNRDPRITANTLRNHQGRIPERWVHLNHPDMVDNFIDREGDGRPDGGYRGLELMIDAAETWWPRTTNGNILTDSPFFIERLPNNREVVRTRRDFIWLQLLNQGYVYWMIAVSDAHTIHGNGVGGWRMYVPSSTDEPREIDWREIVRNSKAGRIMITNGPFLEVTADDGTIAGGLTRAHGAIDLHVKVQCTDWVQIDRIQVMVNGRKPESLNFTRASHPDWFSDGVVQFDRVINVPLSQDSHLIVVAYGEDSDLSVGYGSSWQADMNPCAFNNPIFVDVDGNGFQFNHDTLDYPLPTQNMDADEVRRLMGRAGAE